MNHRMNPARSRRVGLAALAAASVLAVLSLSCGARAPAADAPQADGRSASEAPRAPLASELGLSPAAEAWLAAKRASASPLRAALYLSRDTYEPDGSGGGSGFDYLLVKAMADCVGLNLEAVPQSSVQAFFTLNGAMPPDLGAPGTAYAYVPDLLSAVDLYALPLAVVPWRERLMDMVPVFPTRSQLAGRAGEEPKGLAGLAGKTFAVIPDSFQHKTLRDLAAKEGYSFSYRHAADERGLFELVRSGQADYLLDGSVYFAKMGEQMRGLSLSPFPGDIVSTGWGVKKSEPGLRELVAAYIAAAQRTGSFGELWASTYGMDFTSYLGALFATTERP